MDSSTISFTLLQYTIVLASYHPNNSYRPIITRHCKRTKILTMCFTRHVCRAVLCLFFTGCDETAASLRRRAIKVELSVTKALHTLLGSFMEEEMFVVVVNLFGTFECAASEFQQGSRG